LYTVPAAWVLALAPHIYATALGGKKFDNTCPRTYTSSLKEDQTLDKKTKDRIVRAEGAQQNAFENIGLFAAAVLAGNFAGLGNRELNFWTGGYLFSRVIYTALYVGNDTESIGTFDLLETLAEIMLELINCVC
jgi:uncharacterized MAPEG superfamily protein